MKAGLFVAVAGALLAGCSSPSQTRRGEFGPTFRERMADVDRVLKKSDFSKRSAFEKEITDPATGKKFKTGDYHAKDVKIEKKFRGADEAFNAKGFAQAEKASKIDDKAFQGAEARSRLADGQFRTKDNRMAGEKSREGTKDFAGGAGVFATRENREGRKAIDKNKKPVIIDSDKPTYSEEEVKRLLNKGT
jgi:hypothetical protein